MSRFRGRFLLFGTPITAVGVVLLGVVSGGVRPFRSARVYSGPTQGITDLSLRVELGLRDRVIEEPIGAEPFEVVVVEGGKRVASARGRSDQLGSAEVVVHLPRPRDSALELWVEGSGPGQSTLARGLVLGRRDAFRAAARRRGGFQSGRRSGDIELAVAPAHGALVIAQGALVDELVVRARRNDAPVADAKVRVTLEGAEPTQSEVTTDAAGLARLKVRPSEPQVRVALLASAAGASESTLSTRLEVVQGAIRATRRPEGLRLESSGAASSAFLGFFDERQRYTGLHVALAPAPDGRLLAELPLPPGLPSSPLWVITSSQPDLASPSAVGWPLADGLEPDPKTFDARELLLLDGAPQARLREERRARRIRFVTAAYGAVALLLTLILFVRGVRDAERHIEGHLRRSGLAPEVAGLAPARPGWGLLAAACIGLGFVVLVVFALLKE
jgi:hypothetical protein